MSDGYITGARVKAWLIVLDLSGMVDLGGERIMNPTIKWAGQHPELFRAKLI